MAAARFEWSSELPVPAETAYAWHTRAGALERLTPPWERVRVLAREGSVERGTVVLEVPLGPCSRRWVARHRDAIPGRRLVDEQVTGPFARWVHTRHFEPLSSGRCRYTDLIEYRLPGGWAGGVAAGFVAARLRRAFRYRHATLAADLAVPSAGSLALVVSGAGGLIGRALIPFLTAAGHRVRRLTRRASGPTDLAWDPGRGRLDPAALEGVDAVVHLAGEPIAAGRWTPARRRAILDSRVLGTSLLAETLARLRRPPRVLVSAGAIGIYGNRGDASLTESSPLRDGPERSFVETVGQAWEDATGAADQAGIRVVRARIGLVLSPAGGALGRMLPPFQAGLGGRLGSGRQQMSWIGLDDTLGALYHAILTGPLRGPVNLTAPTPVTNAEFTRTLAEVLHRPAPFPVPAAAIRLLFGAMGEELLLASARVLPARLESSGYHFRHPELAAALRHGLGR